MNVVSAVLLPLLRLALKLRELKLFAVLKQESDVPASVIEAARAGDSGAFRTIIDHYDFRLRALAFRLLESRDLMDDCLQEAYVKAFRSLPKFKGDASLGTWLYRIVYNACIDELRRKRPSVALSEVAEVAQSGASSIDQAVDASDLASAMSKIAPEQRAAVMLVDAYGWSYKEAGKILNVPSGTVASRVNRARVALRAHLEVST